MGFLTVFNSIKLTIERNEYEMILGDIKFIIVCPRFKKHMYWQIASGL